eukprot:6013314-Prymnesium_polylepis.1
MQAKQGARPPFGEDLLLVECTRHAQRLWLQPHAVRKHAIGREPHPSVPLFVVAPARNLEAAPDTVRIRLDRGRGEVVQAKELLWRQLEARWRRGDWRGRSEVVFPHVTAAGSAEVPIWPAVAASLAE